MENSWAHIPFAQQSKRNAIIHIGSAKIDENKAPIVLGYGIALDKGGLTRIYLNLQSCGREYKKTVSASTGYSHLPRKNNYSTYNLLYSPLPRKEITRVCSIAGTPRRHSSSSYVATSTFSPHWVPQDGRGRIAVPPFLGQPRRQGMCSHFGFLPILRPRDSRGYAAIPTYLGRYRRGGLYGLPFLFGFWFRTSLTNRP